MASISESMDQIIYVGIGIFVLVLILSLTYNGYAVAANQMQVMGCNSMAGENCAIAANQIGGYYGAYVNFTTHAGPLPNTFGGALQLAIFALVFIAVILAVLGALRGGGVGTSGGMLGK